MDESSVGVCSAAVDRLIAVLTSAFGDSRVSTFSASLLGASRPNEDGQGERPLRGLPQLLLFFLEAFYAAAQTRNCSYSMSRGRDDSISFFFFLFPRLINSDHTFGV